MNYLIDIMLIAVSAALINNFVLYYFVGICPFIGVPGKSTWLWAWGLPSPLSSLLPLSKLDPSPPWC
ncbi:MAG: hypothetical protein R2860_01495 [Desulfobacterales bacterium]